MTSASTSAMLASELGLQFYKGRRTRSRREHGGWFIPQSLHLLDVVQGRLRIDHPTSPAPALSSGEAILIIPGTRYYICNEEPSEAIIRYAHVHLTLFGTLDVCELCSFPTILPEPAGRQLGDAIEAVAQSRTVADHLDLAGIAACHRAHADLTWQILRHATLTRHGRHLLTGAPRLLPVLHFIRAHLTDPIQRSDLAAVAGLSPSRLSVTFKEHIGQSPMQFIRHLRLERARARLVFEGASVAEVAEQYCFADQFHFSKAFKQAFGIPPSRCRAARAGPH